VYCAKALAINAQSRKIDGSIKGLAKIRRTAQKYVKNDD